jgi:hypothetical protein
MYLPAMKTIRYNVHFAALIVATLVFALTVDKPLPEWIDGFYFCFGLMGALHATAIVVSLRDWKASRLLAALSFIVFAAIWSALTPFMVVWSSVLSDPVLNTIAPYGDAKMICVYVAGSAIGCSGYWLLVRLFWYKSFRTLDWLRTVALCVAGTLSSLGVGDVLHVTGNGIIVSLTVGWWLAFSVGLYWSEVRETRERINPLGQETAFSS